MMLSTYLDISNNNLSVFGSVTVHNEKCVKMRDCGATVYALRKGLNYIYTYFIIIHYHICTYFNV